MARRITERQTRGLADIDSRQVDDFRVPFDAITDGAALADCCQQPTNGRLRHWIAGSRKKSEDLAPAPAGMLHIETTNNLERHGSPVLRPAASPRQPAGRPTRSIPDQGPDLVLDGVCRFLLATPPPIERRPSHSNVAAVRTDVLPVVAVPAEPGCSLAFRSLLCHVANFTRRLDR